MGADQAEDIDFSVVRPLRVMTNISNNIRFDIIAPETADIKPMYAEPANKLLAKENH